MKLHIRNHTQEKIRKCFKKVIKVLRDECYRADMLAYRKVMIDCATPRINCQFCVLYLKFEIVCPTLNITLKIQNTELASPSSASLRFRISNYLGLQE